MQSQLSPEEYCEKIQQLWIQECSYPDGSPDREWLSRERERHFEEFYHLVFPSIVGFLRSLCTAGSAHGEDPEFLANGTMMRIHLALKKGQFQTGRLFRPWCHQIARRIFVDSRRKHTRSEKVLRAAIDHGTQPPAPEHVAVGDLQEFLGRLPTTERQIVELYYLEEKALPEIALVMGKTVASIRSVLYRIKRRLFHGEKT